MAPDHHPLVRSHYWSLSAAWSEVSGTHWQVSFLFLASRLSIFSSLALVPVASLWGHSRSSSLCHLVGTQGAGFLSSAWL